MVALNEFLPINHIQLRDNLSNDLDTFMQNELDMYINQQIITRIKEKMKYRMKSLFSNDHFLYLSMNNEFCTHKFKKGKRDGMFCGKRIRTNLPYGSKPDYLCCKHSKQHIPRKRIMHDTSGNDEDKEVKVPNQPIQNQKKKKKAGPRKIILGNPSFLCFNNILP